MQKRERRMPIHLVQIVCDMAAEEATEVVVVAATVAEVHLYV